MPQNLRTFLRQAIAADAQNVKAVEHRVDRKFAIQAHAAKLAERSEYPALLFMNVEGSRFPCIANVLATYERIALALRCNVKDIPKAYGEMLSRPVPSVSVERADAPVKDVVIDDVDLGTLPIGFHNELDGGPYVTAGVSVLRDPETGVQNAGIYRHHVFSSTTMGCLMGSTHDGGIIHEKYSKRGERTPIAVAIGHHPALLLAAVARLPGIGGEFEAAGDFSASR